MKGTGMTTRAQKAAERALVVLEDDHRQVHRTYAYGCEMCSALNELRDFIKEQDTTK